MRVAEDRPAYRRRMVIREAVKEARRGARYSHLEEVAPPPVVLATGQLEDRMDLAQALRALTPKQRAVVVLRYLEDQSVQEVARTLRVSEGTVKRQCFDAIRRLRPLLHHSTATSLADTTTRRNHA